MDPAVPLAIDTGVWPAIRLLVTRIEERLSDPEVGADELKMLASALSTIAGLEVKADESRRGAPGRPPKDKGDEFGGETLDGLAGVLKEP